MRSETVCWCQLKSFLLRISRSNSTNYNYPMPTARSHKCLIVQFSRNWQEKKEIVNSAADTIRYKISLEPTHNRDNRQTKATILNEFNGIVTHISIRFNFSARLSGQFVVTPISHGTLNSSNVMRWNTKRVALTHVGRKHQYFENISCSRCEATLRGNECAIHISIFNQLPGIYSTRCSVDLLLSQPMKFSFCYQNR